MVNLPTITLDTTLAELYQKGSQKHAGKKIGQVLCGVNSGMSLNENFPRNIKYIYQDTPFNTLSHKELKDSNQDLQHSLAIKYLSLVPQRDAFICGCTPIIVFNVDQTPSQISHDKSEAQKTLDILHPSQRPPLVFCPGPGKIPIKEHGIDLLTCKVVLDQLEAYPPVFDWEKHWHVNTKEALARSGLPTPECEIISFDGHAPDAQSCCSVCRETEAFFISPSCSGPRNEWLSTQISRVLSRISARALPFVVKNQQTYGGAGTFVVTSESSREDLLSTFSSGLLRRLFSQITPHNVHMQPGTVLISDLVPDPIGDYGLTFFVNDDGSAVFLAVSEQMTDSSNAWIGSTINYPRQEELKRRFGAVMQQIVDWLHSFGYCGPCGADILETAAGAAADSSSSGGGGDGNLPDGGKEQKTETNFHIVDLNVRTSGSLCLPLLRGHFESRGLHFGSSFSISLKGTREKFIGERVEDFESGRLCILSWYEDQAEGVSLADVAVGGEDEERLQQEIQRVREITDEVTF